MKGVILFYIQEAGMWTDALRVVKEYLPHKVCSCSSDFIYISPYSHVLKT